MGGTINWKGHAQKITLLLPAAVKFLFFQLAGIMYCSFLPGMIRYAGPAATGLMTFGFIIVWAFFSMKCLAGICGYFRQAAAGRATRL